MTQSKRDTIIASLLASGGVERPGFSKRYTAITVAGRTYLIGKGGALRVTKSTIANSVSVTGSDLYDHLVRGYTWQEYLELYRKSSLATPSE